MEKEDIKEHADRTYEQVSGWINNCDSKASILLALIGVFLTIVFTSDFISQGIIEQGWCRVSTPEIAYSNNSK